MRARGVNVVGMWAVFFCVLQLGWRACNAITDSCDDTGGSMVVYSVWSIV